MGFCLIFFCTLFHPMVSHTFFHPKIANFISQLLSFQQWNSAWAWAAKVRILHGENIGAERFQTIGFFWGFHMCFDHFKPTFVVFPCYFCQKSLGPSGHFLILESWTCPESRVPPLEETRPWYGGITGVFMGLSCLKTSDFLVYHSLRIWKCWATNTVQQIRAPTR